MNQYRSLALHVHDREPALVLKVAEHLLSYGRSFDAAGMPFIIGTAAEDVAEMIVTLAADHPDQAERLSDLLGRTLREVATAAGPLALNGVLKAVLKLALRTAGPDGEGGGPLVTAVGALPRDLVDSALDRMERTDEEVFWEVSDRVVAFDWVEPDLRDRIPDLRRRLPWAGVVRA
jgi:hypothetical protein